MVLVERIITMLTEDDPPVDVDKLLIVTFTEAAASEMKERIRWRLRRNYWNTRYPVRFHTRLQPRFTVRIASDVTPSLRSDLQSFYHLSRYCKLLQNQGSSYFLPKFLQHFSIMS